MEDTSRDILPCFRCGACCTKYQVCVKTSEAIEIANKLGLDLKTFQQQFTDPRWPGVDNFLIRHQNGACIFLDRSNKDKLTGCRIHAFRPEDCRAWTPDLDRRECRQGLKDWGLSVNPAGELQGSPADIQRFRLFLQSLKE